MLALIGITCFSSILNAKSIYTYAYIYTHLFVCIYVKCDTEDDCKYVYVYAYVCVRVRICICICICMCMFDILVLRVGSLGAGSVGFEGQNQFPQSCSSIFRHRVSSCCSISLFMYFNSNFSTGRTAHGSLESICLDPGVGQKRQAH